MTTKTRLLAATALSTFAVTAVLAPMPRSAAAAVEVGKTAAVNPEAVGLPPQEERRVLHVGTNIVADERVQTSARGKAQLLFLDGSALSVGPNSDIVIDHFVYDPDQDAGDLAFTATQGVFRLVGGRISKKEEVTFETPSATIGIRGGIGLIRVGSDGSTRATFLFGQRMTVSSKTSGVTTSTNRPATVDVPPEGDPSPPQPPDDDELKETLRELQKDEDDDQTAGEDGGADDAGGEADTAESDAGDGETGDTETDTAADDGDADTATDDDAEGEDAQTAEQAPAGDGGTDGSGDDIDAALEDSGFDASGDSASGDAPPPPQVAQDTGGDSETAETVETITTDNTTDQPTASEPEPQPEPDPTVTGAAGWFLRELPIDEDSWRSLGNLLAEPNPDNNRPLTEVVQADGAVTVTIGSGDSYSFPEGPGAVTFGAADTDYDDKNLAEGADAAHAEANFQGSGYVAEDGTFFAFASPGVRIEHDETYDYELAVHVEEYTETLVPGMFIYGGTTTAAADFPTSGLSTYEVAGVSGLPFGPLALDDTWSGGVSSSHLYVRHNANMDFDGLAAAPARAVHLQGTIGIVGSGVGQESFGLFELGNVVVDPDIGTAGKPTLGGTVFASHLNFDATDAYEPLESGALVSYVATAPLDGDTAIFGDAADYLAFTPDYVGPDSVVTGADATAIARHTAASNDGEGYWDETAHDWLPKADYIVDYAVKVTPQAEPEPLTEAVTLTGFAAAGVQYEYYDYETYESGHGPAAFTSSDFSLTLDPSNRLHASLSGSEAGDGRFSATFDFGSLDGLGETGSSAVISRDLYAAHSETGTGSFSGVVPQPQSYVTLEEDNYAILVNAKLAPVDESGGLLPLAGGVPVFNLTYSDTVDWGWWSGGAAWSADIDGDDYIDALEHMSLHLGTWVAGDMAAAVDINALAENNVTATYSGHAIATATHATTVTDAWEYEYDIQVPYIAAGQVTHTWDFALARGNLQLEHFDEATLGPTTLLGAADGSGASFGGQLAGVAADGRMIAGTYEGAFFAGAAAHSGMGGTFRLAQDGGTYSAVGTFVADKSSDAMEALTAAPTLAGNGWFLREMPVDADSWNPDTLRANAVAANNQAASIAEAGLFTAFQTATSGETVAMPVLAGDYRFGSLATTYDELDAGYTDAARSELGVSARVAEDGSFWLFSSPGVRHWDYETEVVDIPAFALYGGVTTAAGSFPTSGYSAYAMAAPQGLPFLGFHTPGEAFPPQSGVSISPLYVRHDGATALADMPSDDSRAVHLQANIGILGSGPQQESFGIVEMGNIVVEDGIGKPVFTGTVVGTSRESATADRIVSTEGYVSSAPLDGDAAVFGDGAEHLVFASDYVGPDATGEAIVRETAAPWSGREAWDADAGEYADVPGYVFDYASRIADPAVTGGTEETTLKGYAAAFGTRSYFDGYSEQYAASAFTTGATPDNVAVALNQATGRVQASFSGADMDSSYAATIVFGSLSGLGENGSSAYVGDLDGEVPLFAARSEHETGSFTLAGTMPQDATQEVVGAMFSSGVAPVDGSGGFIPENPDGSPKFKLCKCEYMTWGWWGGVAGYASAGTGTEEEVEFHLATWVAGETPDTASFDMLEQNGVTASYQGHVIADVRNEGAAYIAAGKFTHSWDFAQGAGNVTVEHFDEANIGSATMTGSAAATSGANFSGNFAGGGFSGAYDGSFFGATDGTTAPGGMGGRVVIQNDAATYQGVGTFAADRAPQ